MQFSIRPRSKEDVKEIKKDLKEFFSEIKKINPNAKMEIKVIGKFPKERRQDE